MKIDLTRRKVLTAGAASLVSPLVCPSIVRAAPSGTVYVESWGGSYADAVKAYLLEPFKKATGIDYKHTFFSNNSEQLAKLKTGKSRVDMTFLSNDYVTRGARDKALQSINLSRVPNYKDLYKNFQYPIFDPDKSATYCCSFFYSDTAIAYNEKNFPKPPDSWEELWSTKHKGRVIVDGSSSGIVSIAAILTGQNVNDITDLDIIEKKLMQLKPNLLKWWTSGAEATELFATGEAVIGGFWRGRVNNLRKEGHPIGYVQPKEGTVGWVDTMAIPSTAENVEAALALINFALEAEIQKKFVLEGITYAPTNSKVSLNPEQKKFLGATEEILSRTTFIDPLYSIKNIGNWTELLNRVKA